MAAVNAQLAAVPKPANYEARIAALQATLGKSVAPQMQEIRCGEQRGPRLARRLLRRVELDRATAPAARRGPTHGVRSCERLDVRAAATSVSAGVSRSLPPPPPWSAARDTPRHAQRRGCSSAPTRATAPSCSPSTTVASSRRPSRRSTLAPSTWARTHVEGSTIRSSCSLNIMLRLRTTRASRSPTCAGRSDASASRGSGCVRYLP